MVRADDGPMLRRTLDEMLRLAIDLDWFFQLRLPNRIHWMEAVQMEIQWEELPHHDLDSFLDDYFHRFPGDMLGADPSPQGNLPAARAPASRQVREAHPPGGIRRAAGRHRTDRLPATYPNGRADSARSAHLSPAARNVHLSQ